MTAYAAALWRLTGRLMGLSVGGESAQVWLHTQKFRPTAHRVATRFSARLRDVESAYGLRTLRKTKALPKPGAPS